MSTVQLRVPADPEFVGLLRNNAMAIAAHTQLTLETIADLQLGIGEAFSLVIAHRPTTGDVVTDFVLVDGGLDVVVTGPAGGTLPLVDDWAMMILDTVSTDPKLTVNANGQVTVTLHSRVVTSA